MAGLFQADKSGISRHLGNIYETGELARECQLLQNLQQFRGKATAKSAGDCLFQERVLAGNL